MSFLSFRRFFTPNIFMLLSVLLGVLTGYMNVSFLNKTCEILSKLMTDSLKLLATPIIFVSIVATISGMRSFQEMRNLGVKVFKYTLITTLFAASVALGFYLILNPVQAPLEGVLLTSDFGRCASYK